MTTKLTLNEVVALSLTSHFPLELVPGRTDHRGEKNFRFHCLINHPSIPELSLVFGDEAHGYLFDSAWFSARNGKKVRVLETALRRILTEGFDAPRWTREVPDAESPFVLNLDVLNPDLGYISGRGEVIEVDPMLGTVVSTREGDPSATFILWTDDELEIGSSISFDGLYNYPNRITMVSIH